MIGRERNDTFPGGEVGSIDLEEQLNYPTYVQGDRFILTRTQIWFVHYNGHDGDDWSYNNLCGSSIGWAVPYDAALSERILSAAELLGYRKKIQKGEPTRTKITTDHGTAEQYGYHGTEVRIDYKPAAPIAGFAEFTNGRPKTIDGVPVVQFEQESKKNGKRHKMSPRYDTRPELAELVKLAKVLEAELKAHYADTDHQDEDD